MSRKHNHIEQLTPELIKAYQEGNLSADEMYAVKKFLLENPFEAEALEGLETIDPGALSPHLDDLNARLSSRLTEEEETKVVFWTMTRKIAASLLVLATAAFLFFLQEPDITTKEITQADNKTNQTENEPALDTLQFQKGDGNKEPMMAELEEDSEKKEEDGKTDLENTNSGWTDTNQLQAKSEPSPALRLEVTKEEISREALVVETRDAARLRAANAAEKKKLPPALNPVTDVQAVASIPPPVLTEGVNRVSMDSMGTNLQPVSLDKAIQGNAVGFKSESAGYLKTDLKAREQIKSDSNKSFAFEQAGTGLKAKAPLFTVSGIVVDEQGDPLPFVQVQIKGTSVGMLTDATGAYNLSSTVAIGSLLFRYLGYRTREEEVKDRAVINMEMMPDVSSLGEVVVSDYAPPQPPDEVEVVKNYNPARPVYGRRAFSKHVDENLIYPQAAAAENIRGRVLVEFTVTENGDLKDFKVLKGLGYGCDEEAIRLIKTGPRWQARKTGIDRGTPVDSKVRVRIRFRP